MINSWEGGTWCLSLINVKPASPAHLDLVSREKHLYMYLFLFHMEHCIHHFIWGLTKTELCMAKCFLFLSGIPSR